MSIIQKERKHALDQESDQGKKKKKRKHDLDQESEQEKTITVQKKRKKTHSLPRKRTRKKEKLSFFFPYFLVFLYKFSPQAIKK